MDGEEAPPRDWGDIRNKVIIGLGCSAAVVAWMVFSRPSEERPSAAGFDMGSASGAPSSGRPFAERPKTGLDMVSSTIGNGPAGVDPGIYRGVLGSGSEPPKAPASPPPSDAPAPPAAAAPAANAPAAPPASAQDEAKELASAGIPTDAGGLANLGAKEGMLSALAGKMLDHPSVLRAIFNNKTVVDAFMARPRAKENCQNAGALKDYLSDSKSGGMTNVFPVIQKALSSGAASSLVGALADTEMVKRVSACPSLKTLSNDSSAITSIALGNPKALTLLMDPRGAAALASNPQAAAALASVQSKVGGAK